MSEHFSTEKTQPATPPWEGQQMAKNQSKTKSQITLVGATPVKVSLKLTKMDRLGAAVLAINSPGFGHLETEPADEVAIDMGESFLFNEFINKTLAEIASSDDQMNKEIALQVSLARLYLAMRVDVTC